MASGYVTQRCEAYRQPTGQQMMELVQGIEDGAS